MHVSNATPSRSCELIQADLDCKRGTAFGAGFLALMTLLAVARLRMIALLALRVEYDQRRVLQGLLPVHHLLHVLRVVVALKLSLSRVLHVMQQSTWLSVAISAPSLTILRHSGLSSASFCQVF